MKTLLAATLAIWLSLPSARSWSPLPAPLPLPLPAATTRPARAPRRTSSAPNEELVAHSRRCDGVEDCADGTDEYMCDAAHFHHSKPVTDMTVAERTALTEVSCIKCTCSKGQISIASANAAWSKIALVAPRDRTMLTNAPGKQNKPCNPAGTTNILLNVYKKQNKGCRGWVCCFRQEWCSVCTLALPRPTAGLKRLTRDEYFKKFVVCFLFSLKRMTKLNSKKSH